MDDDIEYEACEACGDAVEPLLLELDRVEGDYICGFCMIARQDEREHNLQDE